ncbi:MAG: metal-sulfur cluster assembly factor [bacterium]|nr:metal-sulfur cluster assembly factor [bacterium]
MNQLKTVATRIVSPAERVGDEWHLLNTIEDPEIGIGIVDLGLIYNVEIENGIATVDMTFTSMGCPAGQELVAQVKETLMLLDDVNEVIVNVVWEPAWDTERVEESLRAMLFGM